MKKLACFFVCLFTASANASVIISDSVGAGEWGLVQFDWSGGLIDINGWGNGYTTGETGLGIGDMYFSLFADDGSDLTDFTGAHILLSDDSGAPGWDSDGSTSGVDPFISGLNLASGAYLLTISDWSEGFTGSITRSSGLHQVSNDYQVTFSDGVVITALNGEPVTSVPEPDRVSVPEPSSIALLGLGLAGLGFARRKKRA